MKFYLSSYKFGDEPKKLVDRVPNGKIAYLPNALDFSSADPERRQAHIEDDLRSLRSLGLEAEILDLRDYFGKAEELSLTVASIGALFISGGNVFVLRQALFLSGLDNILEKLRPAGKFLYAGYSAAGCVLAPSLAPYQIVDDATDTPYEELDKVIWEGLGILDYAIMPHWESDHPESDSISKEVQYCEEKGISYKAIRDGEVIIID